MSIHPIPRPFRADAQFLAQERSRTFLAKGFTLFLIVLFFALQLVAQPSISSFSPTAGPVGTSLTINGSGFSATPAGNIVYFGAQQANVTAASPTALTVVVPAGATYQPISVTTNALTAYSAGPFITTFPGGGLFVQSSFAARTDFPTDAWPRKAEISDLDGDGKTDVVLVHTTLNKFSIFRNTGTAGSVSFAPQVEYATGQEPIGLAIGDIDGDGKPDIAVANNSVSANVVSVYRNTSTPGSVSFAPKIDIYTGITPGNVFIRDMDSDGKPDLLTDNERRTIGIARNTSTSGAISFAAKQEYAFTLDGGISAFSVADLNGDRKPDLVICNAASTKLTLVRNTSTPGTVSLAPQVNITGGGNWTNDIAIGDLDSDGKADLATVTNSNTTISVLKNTSSGGVFSFAPKVDYTVGSTPHSIAINDLDGDGLPDLAVLNGFSESVSLLRNTGAPGSISLASRVDYPIGSTQNSLSMGDLNGDGKPDLTVVNSNSGFSVLLNKVDGARVTAFTPTSGTVGTEVTISGANFAGATSVSFGGTPAASFTVKSPTTITAVAGEGSNGAVSVTTPLGRGWLEGFSFFQPVITSFAPTMGPIGTSVTITGRNFSAIAANNIVYFGAVQARVSAASTTALTVTVPIGASYQPLTVTTYHLTAYSDKPFIVTTTESPVAFTDASFAPRTDITVRESPYGVAIGDLDGDGKPDLAVANPSPEFISILKNTSNGGLISFTPKVDYDTRREPQSIAIGDLNGDGKPDLVVNNTLSGGGNGSAIIYRNTSTPGSISIKPAGSFEAGTGAQSVAVGDLNGDGKPDVVVVNPTYSLGFTVSLLKNTSTVDSISFARKVVYGTGNHPVAVAIGDLTGDGKPDLAVVNYLSNTVSFFRNKSTVDTIAYYEQLSYDTEGNPNSVAIGDLDGDGKPDVAVTNESGTFGYSVYVYRNLSSGGNLSFAQGKKFEAVGMPGSVAMGDINRDGKVDLVIGNQSGLSSVSVLRNTSVVGNISFAPKVDYAIGSGTKSVAIGDIDGDGLPDICTANKFVGTVSILRNTGQGTALVTAINPVAGNSLEVTAYPNPAHRFLVIDNLKSAERWETMDLRSADGKQSLFRQSLKGQTKVTIGLERLNPGLYLISLTRKNGAPALIKFVKE